MEVRWSSNLTRYKQAYLEILYAEKGKIESPFDLFVNLTWEVCLVAKFPHLNEQLLSLTHG
jgi:hypothetical protein